ncbi:CDP-glycerol:poly(glycerophosphate) glycerophosphotransferase [Kribbella flavida DSM 17836]|uniref:CDP-glycerol:poly(Glycerophosphate) glycerophosphotransferase n=1 Tax=Kribbella flavida (strain DSM 17836 / JCM 10339 / NBRC 14399) TaxID=479435 RepID=D2Q4U0_KRIFD|nr:CDP-glycerol glycerophosphotransferase family protein [Kribbella flavida]ADB34195.1 CDP-glycerol:poly(glycerophosphate) glycerophosphotransferase [Kribbella flavida DSM 17836]
MKIVYNAFGGRYCDNPRALYEELVARAPDHEHLWTAAPAYRQGFPAGVRTVPYGSDACIEALESADYVVSNDHLPLDWKKRSGTVFLQTWHGTPLKRIHHDVRWAPEGRLERLDEDVATWNHLLSPNRASTERLRTAFGFSGELHETGYPRNDLLSSPRQATVRAEVRDQLGIAEGTTAVLYTPTWRDDQVFAADQPDFTLQLDLDDFARRLGRDHVLLLRVHSMVADRLAVPAGAPVVDVSNFPDVRDLYAAADVLITDYSSTMFDFAVTGRPIVYFTYDLENYRDQLRGFYFDLAEVAPGPLLRTSADVVDALLDLDQVTASHRDAYAAFRQAFCHLEDGHATDRVIDRIFPDLTGATHPKPPQGGQYDQR